MESDNGYDTGQYDEAFIERAVVLAHAKSRSVGEVARRLCVPEDLLAAWMEERKGRLKVLHLDPAPFSRFRKEPKPPRCPECGSTEPEIVGSFDVSHSTVTELISRNNIMSSHASSGYVAPERKSVSHQEIFYRCLNCGAYLIRIEAFTE